MKSPHLLFPALWLGIMLASSGAQGIDDNAPRFSDPGIQDPSRFIAQPGGSPYYQQSAPPKVTQYSNPAKDSRVVSSYRPADGSRKQ